MRKRQRIISFLLCICMVLSIAAVGSFSGSAAEASAETVAAAFDASHPELAQATIQGGAILHCFCWSYDTIRANLADIKAAGYTAIQTSPVQPPKAYSASYTDTKQNWWKLYQPLDLAVTNGTDYNSWLGNKSQFTQMCTAAESYGIKVIVDIVSNHVAAAGDGERGDFPKSSESAPTYFYPDYINTGVASSLRNKEYYYPNIGEVSSSSRYLMTHGHLGMPELNTSNKDVQEKVLNLMKECVDCGADGFRFDTTKHIELPTDEAGTASDFWPTIIDGINSYKSGLYIYGEILNDAYSKAINRQYAKYMDLTDDVTGKNALAAVRSNNVNTLHSNAYDKEIDAKQAVLWAESHDTYMNNNGSSVNATDADIIKTWAMINSRSSSTSLFFVRPRKTGGSYSDMGTAGNDETWKSKAVVESNKFKNLFAYYSEYLSYDTTYSAAYNERGTKGMVIVKTNGGGSVSLTAHKLADGTYLDHVSNTNFTVTNSVITGTIDSSGVAVIYNANDVDDEYITAKTLYLKPEYQYWNLNNERYAMYLSNFKTETWVDMEDPDGDGIYESTVPEGKWTSVIFCRMNGSTTENNWNNKWNQTVDISPPTGTDNMYTVSAKDKTDYSKYTGSWSYFDGVVKKLGGTLYLDFRTNCQWWADDNVRLYAYFFNGSNTGVWGQMSDTDTDKVYMVTIPEGNYNKVVFKRLKSDTTTFNSDDIFNSSIDMSIPLATDNTNCCFFEKDKDENNNRKATWTVYPSSHTHSYTSSWAWSVDETTNLATATLTLECSGSSGCGRKVIICKKDIAPVTTDDTYSYSVTYSYNSTDYTNSHTEYKPPEYKGNSVTVDGKIGLYFYVDLHKSVDSPKITFTCNNKTTEEALVPDGEKYRAAFYVAPKQMGDTVTATVTVDGKTTSKDYTVKDYLLRLYRNENGEAGTEKTAELQALARSMLNYGAKAQLQFGYKTSEYELVDYGLDAYTPATPSGISKITEYNLPSDYHLAYAGSSLILNNDTTLRVFFSKTDGFTSAPTLTCGGKTLAQGTKGSYITYDITGIAAPNVLNTHTVTFPNNSTANFTACNYILNNYQKSGTLGAVVTALYDYSVKASAYLPAS